MNELKPAHLFAQSIGPIDFDAIISEQHESSLAVSEYPVESGAPIADHSYRENAKLTLTVGQGITRLVGDNLEDDVFRLVEFFDRLKQAQANAELLEVATGIELYENMVIRSLSTVRDSFNTTIVQVVVSLQEVRIANVNSVDRFAARYSEAGGVRQRASSNVTRGQVDVQDVTGTAEAEDVDRSVAKSGLISIVEFLGL